MKKKINLMSGDASLISQVRDVLSKDHDVQVFDGPESMLDAVLRDGSSLLVLDLDFKGKGALEVFKKARRLAPFSKIMIISDTASIPDAVEMTKQGAVDFLRKPLQIEQFIASVKQNITEAEAGFRFDLGLLENSEWLLGTSARIKQVFKSIESEVRDNRDILLICENCIDAGVLAEIIHMNGKAPAKRLDIIDLASFNKESSESFFWNVIQEIFTDINSLKSDSCGTIFFKNFDVIDRNFQESVLQYLDKTFKKAVGPKVRLVIQMNMMEDMLELDKKGLLHAFSKIDIPTLRERREDIPAILNAYLIKYSAKYGKEIKAVSNDLMEMLMSYDWPGNIIELESLVENAVAGASSGVLGLDSFPVNYRMMFDKLIKQTGERAPVQEAEEKLLRDVVRVFSAKTGKDREGIADLIDMQKDFIP